MTSTSAGWLGSDPGSMRRRRPFNSWPPSITPPARKDSEQSGGSAEPKCVQQTSARGGLLFLAAVRGLSIRPRISIGVFFIYTRSFHTPTAGVRFPSEPADTSQAAMTQSTLVNGDAEQGALLRTKDKRRSAKGVPGVRNRLFFIRGTSSAPPQPQRVFCLCCPGNETGNEPAAVTKFARFLKGNSSL